MKKFALLSVVAMALAVTACDDNDIIDIPVNDKPLEFAVEDLTMTTSAEMGATLDLASLENSGKLITLANYNLKNFPAGYDLNVIMQLSATETFDRVVDIPVTVEENTLTIKPVDLQGFYYDNISKGPKERTVYVRYEAYAVKDQTSVRLGNPEYFWGPVAMTVLPMPSNFTIEENYYLLGTVNGWSVASALKFSHSDINQYDDPVFSIKVDITPDQAASGWWWKIVPESTYVTGNWVDGDNTSFGVAENGSEDLKGILVGRTADKDCGAGCLKVAGPYILTINMEEGTYEFTSAIENLWTPGNSNGWNQGNSQMLYTDDFIKYYGYVHLNGDFKFTSAPNWDGINYGNAGTDGKLSTDGGAGNLSVGKDALYWAYVNLPGLTYELTEVATIGIIGNATPGGWDASTALTPSADFLTWTGEFNFKGTGEWKFRANNGWDINLGGSLSKLEQNGGNLATPGEGTYVVKLDLSKLPYSCTVTKK